MSGTGKKSPGYTLLEVLAVIVLLGLVMLWAVPETAGGGEKVALQNIRRLIASDIEQVKLEAKAEQMEIALVFEEKGYHVQLPDTRIERDFASYGFAFHIPKPAEDAAPAEEGPKPFELIIKPDGACENFSIDWVTPRFNGGFRVDKQGTLDWISTPKGKP